MAKMKWWWAIVAVAALVAMTEWPGACAKANAKQATDLHAEGVRHYEAKDGARARRALLAADAAAEESARVGGGDAPLLAYVRANANVLLARIALGVGRAEEARKHARDAAEQAELLSSMPPRGDVPETGARLLSQARVELGHTFASEGDAPTAARHFHDALSADGTNIEAAEGFGQALFLLNNFDAAATVLRRAADVRDRDRAKSLEMAQTSFTAWRNAASAQAKRGDAAARWTGAAYLLTRALATKEEALAPPTSSHLQEYATLASKHGIERFDVIAVATMLLKASVEAALWSAREWLERVANTPPFEALLHHPGSPPWTDMRQRAAAARHCSRCSAAAESMRLRNAFAARSRWSACVRGQVGFGKRADREPCRLRVAYLSADWRDHPCGRVLEKLLVRHWLRDDVSAAALAINPPPPTNGTHARVRERIVRRVRKAASVRGWQDKAFVDVSGADASNKALKAIDEIDADILVDAMGFTAGHLEGVAGARAAPIKVMRASAFIPEK